MEITGSSHWRESLAASVGRTVAAVDRGWKATALGLAIVVVALLVP